MPTAPDPRWPSPNDDQLGALWDWQDQHGRNWKEKLRNAWMGTRTPALLQQLRNSHGPEWLMRYRLAPRPSRRSRG